MKNVRKTLALVLALVMILSLSISASAAVTVEWDKARYEAAATKIDKVPADLSGKTVILHTNDVHGALELYTKVAALKADFEAAGATVLLVDAGDYSSGNPYVTYYQGASAIELMNAVGYDYAILGNHEFDFGWATLQENLKKAECKILSDVQYQGKDAFDISALVTNETTGLKLGLFGVTTPETATKAHPDKIEGVTWPAEADMMKVAQTAVDKLKADGADLVIGITHLGVEDENLPNSSRNLYDEVTGIDFILDGHTHAVMTAGEGGEPIQSTGTELVNVGVVVIDNATKKIESHCLFSLENYAKEDASVKAISDRLMKEVADKYGVKFAESEVDLAGANKIARRQETNLGDLIADALIWQFQYHDKKGLTVDADHVVAITNGGGIRKDIAAGDVTMFDINNVLPFGNAVTLVYVTGAELLEALEASTPSFPMGAFPQIAGMQITINDAKAFDEGDLYPKSTFHAPKSIQRVTIDSINGKAFDEKATYAVVTNDFIAAGGDTYYAFKNASSQYPTGIPMDEVVMDYIKTELKGTITAEKYGKPQGRITIKDFADVGTAQWYADAVHYAVENKIMNGVGDGKFAPDSTVTRGMVMTMIARMEGVDTTAGEGQQWYDKGVAWAMEKGISDGTDPTGSITREQFATMLYRYIKEVKGGGFIGTWMFLLENPDAASISDWADEAMHWMVMNKVINGIDDAGNLAPQNGATRAQVAQMLLNYSKAA